MGRKFSEFGGYSRSFVTEIFEFWGGWGEGNSHFLQTIWSHILKEIKRWFLKGFIREEEGAEKPECLAVCVSFPGEERRREARLSSFSTPSSICAHHIFFLIKPSKNWLPLPSKKRYKITKFSKNKRKKKNYSKTITELLSGSTSSAAFFCFSLIFRRNSSNLLRYCVSRECLYSSIDHSRFELQHSVR